MRSRQKCHRVCSEMVDIGKSALDIRILFEDFALGVVWLTEVQGGDIERDRISAD